jgi:hypothetical protein
MLAYRDRLLRPWFLLFPDALAIFRNGNVGLLATLLLLLLSSGLTSLPYEGAEAEHFVQDHLTHLLDILHHLEMEVEGCGTRGLIGGIVPNV